MLLLAQRVILALVDGELDTRPGATNFGETGAEIVKKNTLRIAFRPKVISEKTMNAQCAGLLVHLLRQVPCNSVDRLAGFGNVIIPLEHMPQTFPYMQINVGAIVPKFLSQPHGLAEK